VPPVRSTLGPSEVARLAGVSADTLRHYEKKGLLPAPSRTSSGYRRYPAETVPRVQLIQRALVIGFSLDELARVLCERDRGGAPCQGVYMLVNQRLADLDRQLEELTGLRAELRRLVEDWDRRLTATPPGRRAHLLETLAGRPAVERARTRGGGIKGQRGFRRPRKGS
jgi:MerR family copper efflux transcriptional regulator